MTAILPPRADRRRHSATFHGTTREDPYSWLRAENWQEVMQDPGTLPADIHAYLAAENAYFKAGFETAHAELIEAIYKEIRGRIKEDDSGVPTPDGPWAYNSRMLENRQYPLLVRQPRGGGPEPPSKRPTKPLRGPRQRPSAPAKSSSRWAANSWAASGSISPARTRS